MTDFIDKIEKFNIPVVQTYNNSLSELKNKTDIEGVVVKFYDGHMIKVKTDWYVAIHKAKDSILQEKNVVRLILEEKIDDIIPHLMNIDKNRLIKYKEELINNIDLETFIIEQHLSNYEKTLTKKDYALQYAQNDTPIKRSIIFSCWGNDKNIREEVIKFVLKYCSSQTKLDEIRYILPEKW